MYRHRVCTEFLRAALFGSLIGVIFNTAPVIGEPPAAPIIGESLPVKVPVTASRQCATSPVQCMTPSALVDSRAVKPSSRALASDVTINPSSPKGIRPIDKNPRSIKGWFEVTTYENSTQSIRFVLPKPTTSLMDTNRVLPNPKTRLIDTNRVLIQPKTSFMDTNRGHTAAVAAAAADVQMTVLSKDITFGANGPVVPVRLDYDDGSGFVAFRDDVSQLLDLTEGDTSQVTLDVGLTTFRGMSAHPTFAAPSFSMDALSTGMNVITVTNQDPELTLANILSARGVQAPFGTQSDIAAKLPAAVLNGAGDIVLPDGAILMFFELGTTNPASSAYDFQDLILLVQPVSTPPASRLFVGTIEGSSSTNISSTLFELDPTTGQTIGSVSLGGIFLDGLEYLNDGRVLGLIPGIGSLFMEQSLVEINVSTGTVSQIGGPLGISFLVEGGLAVQPGTGVLYGVQNLDSANTLLQVFTLNTTTGAATIVGSLPLSFAMNEFGDLSGVEFSPMGDFLYLIDNGASNAEAARVVKIDVATFSVVSTVTIVDGAGLALGLGATAGFVRDDISSTYYLIDGDSGADFPAGFGTSVLRTIDPETGQTSAIGVPAELAASRDISASALLLIP